MPELPPPLSWSSTILGLAVLALGLVDFAWTTISLKGSGPITRRLGKAEWRAMQALGTSATRLTPVAGPLILLSAVCCWIAVAWLGWTLVFLGGGEFGPSLEAKPGQPPSGLLQVLAFIGSALSTLGSSLAQPTTPGWDLLSTLAAVNGFVLLTLAVTFVLNVASAVAHGRALSMQAHAAWIAAREAPARAESAALALGDPLLQFVSNYAAFPLAGYFATGDRRQHLPTAILKLAQMLVQGADRRDGRSGAGTGQPQRPSVAAAHDPQRGQMLLALETLVVAPRGEPAPKEDWPPERLLHEVERWYRSNSLLPLPEWWGAEYTCHTLQAHL